MPELVVIHKPLYYGGKQIEVGGKFVATAVDAADLKKKLKAKDAPVSAPVRKVAETQPRAVERVAEPEAEAPKAPFYRTRRLKADD